MKNLQQLQGEFRRNGIVGLKSFIPTRKTQAAKDRIMEDLSRLNLRVGGIWQTKKFEGISAFQISNKIGQSLTHFPEYDRLIPDDMTETLCSIAGAKLSLEKTLPRLLITPPQKQPWELPNSGWHVDVSIRNEIPGMQIFVLLDKLDTRGGATLAVVGSHLSRDIAPSVGTVVEMSGNAGDVFVMDMRVVHAPSINARKDARLMMTCRYLSKKV